MPVSINTPLKRQIRLYGLDASVNITLHKHGLEMGLGGSKTKLFVRWNDVANILTVPANAPSIFVGKPFKYLQYLADKAAKKAERKAAKAAKKGTS